MTSKKKVQVTLTQNLPLVNPNPNTKKSLNVQKAYEKTLLLYQELGSGWKVGEVGAEPVHSETMLGSVQVF